MCNISSERKMLGGLIYLLAYGMYFGLDIVNNLQTLISAVESKYRHKFIYEFITIH